MNLSLGFWGGAGTVTGANFLLTDQSVGGARLLIDCGLFQGSRIFEAVNREQFRYDPKLIDALFVTHAHLDHIGRIPKLVREGFRGVIYSTAPTRAIAELCLLDSLGVMTKEAHGDKSVLLYQEEDVVQAMNLWQELNYDIAVNIKNFTIILRNAGHILGSAMVEVGAQSKKIVFTGDLGNTPAFLLPEVFNLTDADWLVVESVYGDRLHEAVEERTNRLEDVIETTMRAGGTLMIPAFSVERTQELLLEIERMMEEGRVPPVPVFLDSPLAIEVTKIYKKYQNYFNDQVVSRGDFGDGIFNFPNLRKTLTTEESRSIAAVGGPKIIIAGSGMSNGGRILHHEKRYLSDAKNTLLLVGFQSAGSLGRELQDGARQVTILGEQIPVRAAVVNLTGYSAHRDWQGLLQFVEGNVNTLQKVFVAMGEPRSSLFLAQKIRDYLGVEAIVPELSQVVDLSISS